jgi:hypothetical protein
MSHFDYDGMIEWVKVTWATGFDQVLMRPTTC